MPPTSSDLGDASKEQCLNVWTASLADLHNHLLQRFVESTDVLMLKQQSVLESVLAQELGKQTEFMKRILDDPGSNFTWEAKQESGNAKVQFLPQVSEERSELSDESKSLEEREAGFDAGLSLKAGLQQVGEELGWTHASKDHSSSESGRLTREKNFSKSSNPEAASTLDYSSDWDLKFLTTLKKNQWKKEGMGKDFVVLSAKGYHIDDFNSIGDPADFPLRFVKKGDIEASEAFDSESHEQFCEVGIARNEAKGKYMKTLVKQFRLTVGWHKKKDHKDKTAHPHNRHASHRLVPHSRSQQLMITATNNMPFNVLTALLILSNTAAIAVEADVSMRNAIQKGDTDTQWMQILDLVFTIIFTIELASRIFAERSYFIYGPSNRWNLFDLVVVGSSLVDNIMGTFMRGSTQGGKFNLSFMRLLRVFRLLRVLRIIRIFRVFRQLRLMVVSILTSMLTLTWAFVLLMLLMLCFAICFLQGSASWVQDHHTDRDAKDEHIFDVLTRHFSSMSVSMYTLLAVISGGKEWHEIAQVLEEISPVFKYLFLFYIIFVVFGVLNVLTGVFVESASEISRFDHDLVLQSAMDQEESFMNQIEDMLRELDEDDSDTITWTEMEHAMRDPRIKAYLAELQMDVQEAEGIFRLLDVDESGEVGIEEFMIGCVRLKGHSKSIDIATMMYEQKKLGISLVTQFEALSKQIRGVNTTVSSLSSSIRRQGVQLSTLNQGDIKELDRESLPDSHPAVQLQRQATSEFGKDRQDSKRVASNAAASAFATATAIGSAGVSSLTRAASVPGKMASDSASQLKSWFTLSPSDDTPPRDSGKQVVEAPQQCTGTQANASPEIYHSVYPDRRAEEELALTIEPTRPTPVSSAVRLESQSPAKPSANVLIERQLEVMRAQATTGLRPRPGETAL